VRGPFDAGMQEKLERRVRQIVAQRANLVFLQLECGGGDPVIARQLADFFSNLRDDRGDDPVMTVAFVTRHSHDLALFLALGCTEIIMDEKAKLGDFEDLLTGRPKAGLGIEKLLVELAQEQGYSPLLVRGMVNPDLAIYRVRNQKGRLEQVLVDAAELEKDQKDKKKWGDPEAIKKPGQWFYLNADEAMKPGIGLSQHKFEGDPDKSFAEVKN
jgi:hypothetical protein